MGSFRCQSCYKVFSIPITLEVMAIAEDPHVVLCAECELARERIRAVPALSVREVEKLQLDGAPGFSLPCNSGGGTNSCENGTTSSNCTSSWRAPE